MDPSSGLTYLHPLQTRTNEKMQTKKKKNKKIKKQKPFTFTNSRPVELPSKPPALVNDLMNCFSFSSIFFPFFFFPLRSRKNRNKLLSTSFLIATTTTTTM
jgi:hypothetical protein